MFSYFWEKSCFPLKYRSQWKVKSAWETSDPQDVDSITPMIVLSTWIIEIRRGKSTASRSITHKWTVSLLTEVLHLWPYSSDKKHLHCHFVFHRQFPSFNFQQTGCISQIQKYILAKRYQAKKIYVFQLWQDLFCTWKYKHVQTRENSGEGPRCLSYAMAQSSYTWYSCIVSSC